MSNEIVTAGTAAARWWAEQIGAPVFRNVDDDSSPQERFDGGFAGAMQAMIAARHPVNAGQGEKFVEALAPIIDERLNRVSRVSLAVDYGPDMELANAAEKAGINLSRFPWKTHMSIRRDHVTASLGYRAPDKLIWTAPGWLRPQCRQHQYTEDWQPLDFICSRPIYHDEEEHGDWMPDPDRCMHCGGTYSEHYGRNREYPGHSYEVKSS